jgi:hypothetical protein
MTVPGRVRERDCGAPVGESPPREATRRKLCKRFAAGPSGVPAEEADRKNAPFPERFLMELAGLEPATSWVRSRRSPN